MFINLPVIGANSVLVISLSTTMISYLVLHLKKTAKNLNSDGQTTLELSTFRSETVVEPGCMRTNDEPEHQDV